MNEFSSALLSRAVSELSRLPGIGEKTALRLALFLLKEDEASVERFGQSIIQMRKEIRFCKNCHNISDQELCEICANPKRDAKLLCVVEDIRDVMAIENTAQFRGYYHVLGGIISPIDGIGPADINLSSLSGRLEKHGVEEMILALPPTVEGDTTSFYIYRMLKNKALYISVLSKGISVGNELQYTDELTLARSIQNRVAFDGSHSQKL